MILFLLIILGTIFQSVVMLRSGSMYQYGIAYFGPLARDGVWHEALSKQLVKNIPPFNPGFSGEILINYHYFYDLVISLSSRFMGLDVTFLIYKLFPVLLSILLGVATYKLALKLFTDKKTALLSVFFAYFASSFGWVIDILKHRQIGGESAFWANQPVSMNINPPYAVSLVVLIFSILLLARYLEKPKISTGLILGLLFGTLIGFKAYAGAIAIFALSLITAKKFFVDKKLTLVPVFLLSLGIFTIIFLLNIKGAKNLIIFQPLWLIDTMIDAGDRVGIPDFTAKRFAYLGGHKYLFYAALETIGFVIFFIGNLGTRIIGVWGIRKKFFKNDLHLYIFFLIAASFIPPLIFVQKGNPWNIIQFFYYFLFFTGLYAANFLKRLSMPVLILILLLTPISSLATFRSWLYPNPPSYIPAEEVSALKYLATEPDGTILKKPFDPAFRSKFKDPYTLAVYADNAYVSATSGKQVYLEDAEQQLILDSDYKVRENNARRFFIEKNTNWSAQFLLNNKIKYIYLPKIFELPMAEEEYPMQKIFENNAAKIYKIMQ